MNPLIPILVTGAVALLGLIITKESKVSEFRQAWIDALREDVAVLLAAIHTSLLLVTDNNGEAIREHDSLAPDARSALTASLREANAALFTIRLRLNPTEPGSIAILTTLDEIEELSNDNDALSKALTSGESMKLEAKLLAQARDVLSAEWVRVKQGEPYFKWTRRFVAILAVVVTVVVVAQGTIQAEKMPNPVSVTHPKASPVQPLNVEKH